MPIVGRQSQQPIGFRTGQYASRGRAGRASDLRDAEKLSFLVSLFFCEDRKMYESHTETRLRPSGAVLRSKESYPAKLYVQGQAWETAVMIAWFHRC